MDKKWNNPMHGTGDDDDDLELRLMVAAVS